MLRLGLALLLLLAPAAAAQEDEKDFVPVFNGKDWTGLKFFFGGDKPGDEPKAFSIADGSLVCSGKPAGYWFTEKKYKDCILRFEYRYPRPAGLAEDAKFRGNSGYLFFVNEHKVWPYSIETQGADRSVGDIFFIGEKDKAKNQRKVDGESRKKALKPVGEWSAYEVVVKAGTMTVSINGTKITEVASHEYPGEGHIGFQSEGAEIHWRNIRIKTL